MSDVTKIPIDKLLDDYAASAIERDRLQIMLAYGYKILPSGEIVQMRIDGNSEIMCKITEEIKRRADFHQTILNDNRRKFDLNVVKGGEA